MRIPIETMPGPMLRGECNQCGACCVVERDGVRYTCTFLGRFFDSMVGDPKATRCTVYFSRTHWMPIEMLGDNGTRIYANCAGNGTEQETLAIIRNGIGKGCSMEVVA